MKSKKAAVTPPASQVDLGDDPWAKEMAAALPAPEPEPEVVATPPRRERQPRLPFVQTEQQPENETRVSPRPFTMQLRNEPLRPSLRQQVMNDDESHSVEFLKRALERALRERDAAIVMYEMRVREDGH